MMLDDNSLFVGFLTVIVAVSTSMSLPSTAMGNSSFLSAAIAAYLF